MNPARRKNRKTENWHIPHLDASENLYFGMQLQEVRARSYDIKLGNLKARTLIPVDNSIPETAEVVTYVQYTSYGMAKIIASYADDLPRADVSGKQFSGNIRTIGNSYGYNLMEIKKSAAMGVPLDQRKANAARRANEEKVDALASTGDAANQLLGFLNQPNALLYTVPDKAAAGTNSTWTVATPAEILADVHGVAQFVVTSTKGVEQPDTLILSPERYGLMATTYMPNTTLTVLRAFLETDPYIKNIEQWAPLSTAGAGGTQRMVCYRRDPDALQLIIPKEWQQLPPQVVNLETKVPCYSRFGGVVLYYPLSMCYGDNI